MVGIAGGKPTVSLRTLSELRTVSVRCALGRIGTSGGRFEGWQTPEGLGAIAEGLGFGRRLFRRATHLQDDVDDVGQIVGDRGARFRRSRRRGLVDRIFIDRGRCFL